MPYSNGKQFTPLSEGERIFEIYDIGDEIPTKKTHYRVWKFNTLEDGEIQQVWQNLFPWDEVPILESFGYLRDKEGGIKWEIPDVIGKRIKAIVYHQDYNGKTYAKVKDFKKEDAVDSDAVPF